MLATYELLSTRLLKTNLECFTKTNTFATF